jgi:hypothetical protein
MFHTWGLFDETVLSDIHSIWYYHVTTIGLGD